MGARGRVPRRVHPRARGGPGPLRRLLRPEGGLCRGEARLREDPRGVGVRPAALQGEGRDRLRRQRLRGPLQGERGLRRRGDGERAEPGDGVHHLPRRLHPHELARDLGQRRREAGEETDGPLGRLAPARARRRGAHRLRLEAQRAGEGLRGARRRGRCPHQDPAGTLRADAAHAGLRGEAGGPGSHDGLPEELQPDGALHLHHPGRGHPVQPERGRPGRLADDGREDHPRQQRRPLHRPAHRRRDRTQHLGLRHRDDGRRRAGHERLRRLLLRLHRRLGADRVPAHRRPRDAPRRGPRPPRRLRPRQPLPARGGLRGDDRGRGADRCGAAGLLGRPLPLCNRRGDPLVPAHGRGRGGGEEARRDGAGRIREGPGDRADPPGRPDRPHAVPPEPREAGRGRGPCRRRRPGPPRPLGRPPRGRPGGSGPQPTGGGDGPRGGGEAALQRARAGAVDPRRARRLPARRPGAREGGVREGGEDPPAEPRGPDGSRGVLREEVRLGRGDRGVPEDRGRLPRRTPCPPTGSASASGSRGRRKTR